MTRTDWNTLTPFSRFLVATMMVSLLLTSCTSMKKRAAEREAAIQAKAKAHADENTDKSKERNGDKSGDKKRLEPDPLPSDVTEISAPIPETDPEKAYFCEFQALITKFEAYGSTLAHAQSKVKALCVQKFDAAHCVDEEDLHCRKTFY